ncbi:N-acetyldiaminopimelate deacetylase [Lacticaseibacillus parahuelsenbergensis]|uniref:N-acetyldiaminopimelate deacetylase n=1 Tax=Lacticaseibacillus parahuelsenbergensis TaxID=3068305 RepID=A0ABY9L6U3_9LACO|nr:N-acetyldiaminopimelate deacetylase [Lacticaseibacillus sp. NCIMB 15471]WLV78151.1 N-acetyldiaminopimelate deacetylase [Lacticaseibacillus sp. NCIMB 15471]
MKEAELIAIRRQLHQIPELALQEKETHAFLLKTVQSFPQTHLTIRTLPKLPTALLVKVHGQNPQRTIGYRTDIDALPVTEQTGLPFSSQHSGIAHACGHDIHMTVALGILDYFAHHQPKDNLIFFFQPAEESKNGGKLAYDMGTFTGDWHIDEFYGLHDRPDLPAGTISTRLGTLFAGTTEINVDLIGKSGHAALPQNANDMIVAAASFINQIQTVVARNVSPTDSAVITFGLMRAGTIRNVIAGRAYLEGTLRGFTQKQIDFLQQRIRDIGRGIAASFNCDVNVDLNQGGYYPVENNPQLTKDFIQYMQSDPAVTFAPTGPVMTGEDFGYLLNKIPGTMFWLGVNDPDSQLHAADFSPDESALAPGVTAVVYFLEHRMAENN